MDCIQEFVLVEWFNEVSECAGGKRSFPSLFICPMRSHEDDRYSATLVEQMTLQFSPAHPGHPNIGYETCDVALEAGGQEVFRHIKAADRTAIRFQKVTDGILDRVVVVDDCNQVRIVLD